MSLTWNIELIKMKCLKNCFENDETFVGKTVKHIIRETEEEWFFCDADVPRISKIIKDKKQTLYTNIYEKDLKRFRHFDNWQMLKMKLWC